MAKKKTLDVFPFPNYKGLSLLDQFNNYGKTVGEIGIPRTRCIMKINNKTLLDIEQFTMFYNMDPDFHYSLPTRDSANGSFATDWPMIGYRVEFIRDFNDPQIKITNLHNNTHFIMKNPVSGVLNNYTTCEGPFYLDRSKIVRYIFTWDEVYIS